MSEPEQFLLRWRGRTTGPHSWPAILQMLDEHEIGLFHEIQHQGRWLDLGDFIQSREQSRAAAASLSRKGPIKVQPLAAPEPAAPESGPVLENAPVPEAASAPMPVAAQESPAAQGRFRPKSLKRFIGLGMCFGFVGAHNFYAGYWVTALVQLVLSVLTVWFGFGFFVAWLWAFIELLLVHTDCRGVRMT